MSESQTTQSQDNDVPVWGAAAIARVINRPVRAVHYMLPKGYLDATLVGGRYVSTPRRLLASLSKPVK